MEDEEAGFALSSAPRKRNSLKPLDCHKEMNSVELWPGLLSWHSPSCPLLLASSVGYICLYNWNVMFMSWE